VAPTHVSKGWPTRQMPSPACDAVRASAHQRGPRAQHHAPSCPLRAPQQHSLSSCGGTSAVACRRRSRPPSQSASATTLQETEHHTQTPAQGKDPTHSRLSFASASSCARLSLISMLVALQKARICTHTAPEQGRTRHHAIETMCHCRLPFRWGANSPVARTREESWGA
jgi:hypothetical protein